MAGFVSPDTLERIRSANDIVDVIGAVLPLKKAGANFQALCPFHREKSPSFHVNPRKQTFHCFGCHKGGDVFTFIREYESVEFPEAVKRLAERARIPLEMEQDTGAREQRFLKDKLLDIHEQITQRWHNALKNDATAQRARDYLAQRQVSSDAINLFRLGFAPEGWDDTVNWARSKSFDMSLMEQAGLVSRKEGSDHFYGRFRGRLMFPICDEQGRVIGFSGRVLPGDDDDRKYVNSPETPLFLKSKVMFGLDKSKRALLDKQFAVVCEGQLDLIACFMAGIQNIVAPQGTAFTSEHARILKRYVKEVVLCFDSDAAGQKAAVRVLDDLLGSGLAIRVATVPAPHDPDSFIKEFGAHAFEKLISDAEGFFDFYLKRLAALNDVTTDKGQQEVVRAMAEAVGKTGDPFLIDRYARKTAALMGVNTLNAVQGFKKILDRRAPQRLQHDPGAPLEQEEPALPPPNTAELWLLKVLLAQDDLLDWARQHLELSWIEHRLVRQVLELRLSTSAAEPLQPAAILHQVEPAAQSLVTQVLGDERPHKHADKLAEDATLRLRNAAIDKEMAHINQQLTSPELTNEDNAALLHELAALRAAKKEPLQKLHADPHPDSSAHPLADLDPSEDYRSEP